MARCPYWATRQGARRILKTNAETVALTTTDHLGPEGVRELSWDLHKLGVDLVVTPGVVDVAGPRLTMRPVAGLPLIHVEKPQYSGTKKVQKLAFDYCVSMSVLLCAVPVMIAAAIAIKLTSKGPVFYRSERIGLEGEPFQMIKFRTMVDGADKQVAHARRRQRERGWRAFQDQGRSAHHAASESSCASTASTSCRSSSTCCGAR